MALPTVTFGFVNCNRLHYLKSTVESFLESTKDYPNLDLIIVDNASTEVGTEEYLNELKEKGFKIFSMQKRDPNNEYAKAINVIIENAIGDYIAPIAADMQFVIIGKWLHRYVEMFEKHISEIGCISFDAQRSMTNQKNNFSDCIGGEFKFVYNYSKMPLAPSCNVMYNKKIINKMYPWEINCSGHEGTESAEVKMVQKIRNLVETEMNNLKMCMPILPVSILIYNNDGDNAKVRGFRRYGYYNPPLENYRYYQTFKYDDIIKLVTEVNTPIGLEAIAQSIGWNLPLDENGHWVKRSLNIETCKIFETLKEK